MANNNRSKSKKVQILLNSSLNSQLSLAAKRCGITKSAFVRVALEREFAQDEQLAEECSRLDRLPLVEEKKETPQLVLF